MNPTIKKVIGIVIFMGTMPLLAIEEPKYQVLEKNGDIEIRLYESYIIAETIIENSFEDAGSDAHRILFDYISGKNIKSEKIEMTAPVVQENAEATGEKIEMTAPVTQKTMGEGRYRVSFIMPDNYTMETIPQPRDQRIRLIQVPSRKVIVIEYSGTWSKENYEEHESELREYIAEKGYKVKGDAIWARYNPPFIPWLFRRNEIMIEIL